MSFVDQAPDLSFLRRKADTIIRLLLGSYDVLWKVPLERKFNATILVHFHSPQVRGLMLSMMSTSPVVFVANAASRIKLED